jgi:adenylate cyclase
LRVLLLGLVACGATGLALAAYATDVLRSLEGSSINTRFSIRGAQRAPRNIVVVGIDANTFDQLNLSYPFPRHVHAELIERIASERPAAIAYDVQFTESSPRGPKDDEALVEAIERAGGTTVFSTTETNGHGNTRFLGSSEGTKILQEIGSRPANGLFPYDPGGVIRRMAYSIGGLDTLAVATAEVATHRHVARAGFGGEGAWIDFAGPTNTFPYVSFSDALSGKIPHSLLHGEPAGSFFRGKIVVVGATAPTLQDIHPTSTDSQMPGPEIQANAIDTVLRGLPLASTAGWIDVVLIVVLGVAVPLASLRVGAVPATALALALGAGFVVAVQLAFDAGTVVPVVYPLGALILSAAGALGVQLVTEAFERVRVRDLFARFVPENVVDEVLASADGLRLGGVQREGTVMFADLRGFTTLAETLTPARVIEVLNRYLSEMSDAILDHGGTLVAYMGDGIMAVFGAPLPQADHADRALGAAREMLEVRLPRVNEWLRTEQISEGFRMGIGLNSGHVMSGHVGSERRVEYTAVGDTTNSAARIEQLTKGTPHQLLLAEATKRALLSEPEDLLYVGPSEIRGRHDQVTLWSLREEGKVTDVSERTAVVGPPAAGAPTASRQSSGLGT